MECRETLVLSLCAEPMLKRTDVGSIFHIKERASTLQYSTGVAYRFKYEFRDQERTRGVVY